LARAAQMYTNAHSARMATQVPIAAQRATRAAPLRSVGAAGGPVRSEKSSFDGVTDRSGGALGSGVDTDTAPVWCGGQLGTSRPTPARNVTP